MLIRIMSEYEWRLTFRVAMSSLKFLFYRLVNLFEVKAVPAVLGKIEIMNS